MPPNLRTALDAQTRLHFAVRCAMRTAAELVKERRDLEAELDQLVDRRSACMSEAGRLELMPEANRILGAMERVEKEFENLTGQKMEGSFE